MYVYGGANLGLCDLTAGLKINVLTAMEGSLYSQFTSYVEAENVRATATTNNYPLVIAQVCNYWKAAIM